MKFCTLVILVLGVVSSMAVQAKRAERWDMSIQMLGNFSEKSNGSNGSSVDIDSAVGMAFGGSYHVNEGQTCRFSIPTIRRPSMLKGAARKRSTRNWTCLTAIYTAPGISFPAR